MNINLDFQIEIKKNSLGNGSYKSNDIKRDLFGGLLKNIGSMKDDSKDIDYNLILSVLNNLKILNTENISTDIQIDDMKQDNISNLDMNDLNSIYGYLGDKNINLDNLHKILNDTVLSKEIRVSEEGIELDSIIENLSLSNDEIEFLNNIKNKLDLEDSNYNDILDYTQKNTELKIDEGVSSFSKDINAEKYKELEVNSLSNKVNLIETKDTDKDLVTLETILNEGDSNNFTIINNANIDNKVVSNADINEEKIITNIRQDFLSADVVQTVKHLKSNELEQITVKITPKELGEMSIQLIKDAEETKVKIIISKEDVYNLVNKNLSEITKHLEESNINVKEISVDIKNNEQKKFSDNLNHEFNRRNKENQQNKNKHKRDIIQAIENEEKILKDDNLNILI